ncbi:cardiomyopathy-associated protein 5 [Corythoichthys intestinalis]|uniref:cardiomyopathy-associated protein 5 n=1 Tax=Corythoichthys intestinalis TaxID=161448 RepID=UPI0025A5579B|nr:cardiomyopathy-associated protein 5 [Corythoichthys intestinalis]
MQCLVMDASFSMVTMQGEDSGIAWETNQSCCSIPKVPEARKPAEELLLPALTTPCPSGSNPAGKIIFVMDEEMMSRRRKTKAEGQKKEKSNDISEGLVGISPLTMKEDGEKVVGDDMQLSIFSLVSEGSEILNMVVPHELATVDEEESMGMADNLSYLEKHSASKADEVFDQDSEPTADSSVGSGEEIKSALLPGLSVTDPPEPPVAKIPGTEAACNVDDFEAFSLSENHTPGSPAVVPPEREVSKHQTLTKEPAQLQDAAIIDHHKSLDVVNPESLTSELLEEFFYSGSDNYVKRHNLDGEDEAKLSQSPSKHNGSTLFGSQEGILTPVFLPEGPPKIIDPVLLEEPRAMAFLYNDLYEDAVGNSKKDDETESAASEKSFHSRHSDREARGYLEKYVLIDETCVVEEQPVLEEKTPLLNQVSADFISTHPQCKMPISSEDEITDFFRKSASSSPCDKPFPISEEGDSSPSSINTITQTEVKDTGIPEDPLSVLETSFEPYWDESDDDALMDSDTQMWLQEPEVVKPCPPPRRKTASALKDNLALTPLTLADRHVEEEQPEEAVESVKTTDQGTGNQAVQIPCDVPSIVTTCNKDITDPKPSDKVDTEVALTLTQPDASESEKVYPEKQDDLPTLPTKSAKTTCTIL